MLKKGLSLLLVVIMVLSLSGCSDILSGAIFLFLIATGDDSADKNEVFEFVRENEEELLEAIESRDFSAYENIGIIKEIGADETYVDFYCGGAGIVSATFYVGFYYTSENDMMAVWCAPTTASSLTPSGNGFEWQEPNGDNRYYTEHICNNFYYYEASF